MKARILVLLAAMIATAAFAAAGPSEVYRFDMGTAASAVAEGYTRVTDKDSYSTDRGYGWETEGIRSVSHEEGFPVYAQARSEGQILYRDFLTLVDPLNVDSIVADGDLAFRVDVPNGTYRVSVLVGDMGQNLGSITLSINGDLKEKNITAWHPGTTGYGNHRRILQDPWGFYTPVRHTVEVSDGSIRIVLGKDQTAYDESMAKQSVEEPKWEQDYATEYMDFPPYSRVGVKEAPYYYCGWPFVHNSIMAVEIAPDRPAPVDAVDAKLRLRSGMSSPALEKAIRHFNDGDYFGALQALEGADEDEQVRAAKAIVLLWLAGRLETEFLLDEEIVACAVETLEDYLASNTQKVRVAELLSDARTFLRAWLTLKNKGNFSDKPKNHFLESIKAIGLWYLIKEDSPLYDQAQLQIMRAEHMLIPYFPARGTYREIAKKLLDKYPDNRFAKYHLTGKWEQHGDGTQPYDWVMKDYTEKVKDSPEWVKALYPTIQNQIEWCEWWVDFKQTSRGSIGGGWSDDVEVIGAFGYFSYLATGISDKLAQGTAKFMNGLWEHSVDEELGFSQPLTDAEHAAEETGNTLGMMMQIDYGNPVWTERSMKTGKLIRDLWTDYDVNGHRRFRADYFCASRVGRDPHMAIDSWINYRAVRPALAVMWYNQNPTVSQLVVELADAWLASSMSTQKGKPKGVIPARVNFPDAVLGRPGYDTWYGEKMPGGGYKPYVLELFYNAYRATKDPKYLQPVRLEYDLAKKYGCIYSGATGLRLQFVFMPLEFGHWKYDPKDIEIKNQMKKGKAKMPEGVLEGTEEWVAWNLKVADEWLRVQPMVTRRDGPLVNDLTKADIIKSGMYCGSENFYRWPINTTESGPTDRIGYVGIMNAFLIYTGGRWGGPMLEAAVTYDNTTRDFAAAVMANDPQGLRILYHSLTDDIREIGIRPWHLETGAKYRLTYGPDADEDEKMDTVEFDEEISFNQRGWPIPVTVGPRLTYVIEIDQTDPPTGPKLAPDPAITDEDIRLSPGGLLARVHNIGSKSVRNVEVAAYVGDPQDGGTLIYTETIPHIEAPIDLDPKSTTIGFDWFPKEGERRDIYIVIDPDGKLETEITTFNNSAHALMPPEE